MEVKKNQDYIVTIEDLSVEGEGIGKISEGELGNENGFPLFIKDTVIGDVAKVRVIKVKKNYGYGRLMEIIIALHQREADEEIYAANVHERSSFPG